MADLNEDQKTAKAEEEEDLRKIKGLMKDYENVFGSPRGKRVYDDLLTQCNIFHTTFTGNSQGFFLEGKRYIGLYLLEMMGMANLEGVENLKDQYARQLLESLKKGKKK